MQVLERYLQAVSHWLSVPQREDIVAELSEDIRSQIEEREGAAGRPLEPAEVEALLLRRGHPMWVAEQFLPQQHLIGPALLPVYRTVRKVMLAALAAAYAAMYVIFAFVVQTPPRPEMARLGFWVWYFALYAFAALGFQTVLFAWIERASARARATDEWDPRHPDALPAEPGRQEAGERLRLRVASLGHLVGATIFTLWWLGVLAVGPVPGVDVRLAPIWQLLYWPILAVGLSGAVLAAALTVRPRRERIHAAGGLVRELVAVAVITALLGAGRLLDVAITGAPPEVVAQGTHWLNLSLSVTMAVIGALYALEAVRDVRLLRGRPLTRHTAFRSLAED
jgi:hypothetical protein